MSSTKPAEANRPARSSRGVVWAYLRGRFNFAAHSRNALVVDYECADRPIAAPLAERISALAAPSSDASREYATVEGDAMLCGNCSFLRTLAFSPRADPAARGGIEPQHLDRLLARIGNRLAGIND